MVDTAPSGSPARAQFDLTTANSIQSLFVGPKDLWANELAADFVDFLLWNDAIKLPILTLSEAAARHPDSIVLPDIISDLRRREAGLIVPELLIIDDRRELVPELIAPTLRAFTSFCRANPSSIRKFYELHNVGWIEDQKRSRSTAIHNHYVFDVHALLQNEELAILSRRLQLPIPAVLYLLDLALKYMIYAEAAENGSYLSHPIRSRQHFPHMMRPSGGAPILKVPFRLGPYLVAAAATHDQDWFTSRIHEARAYVHDLGLTASEQVQPVGNDVLRGLAMQLDLPAKIKNYDKFREVSALAESSTGIAGSIATSNYWPAVAGSAMTIASTVWSGSVAGRVARLSWINWMVEWSIEAEKDNRLGR